MGDKKRKLTIFLDIDGVLNAGQKTEGKIYFDEGIDHGFVGGYVSQACSEAFHRWVKGLSNISLSPEIVVSSTWREFFSQKTEGTLLDFLSSATRLPRNIFVGTTTKDYDFERRDLQIKDWVDQHRLKDHEFIVFDDMGVIFSKENLQIRNRAIFCPFEGEGFTDEIGIKANALLRSDEEAKNG